MLNKLILIGIILLLLNFQFLIEFIQKNHQITNVVLFSVALIVFIIIGSIKFIDLRRELKSILIKLDEESDNLESKVSELKNKEEQKRIIIKEYEKKIDNIENEKIELKKILERIKPTYTDEQKANMKRSGDEFEKRVGKYYEYLGYIVEYRGLELGFEDGGIDLIARKGNEVLLIQCKYWKKINSIKGKNIKEFYGNCNFYIDQNNLNRKNVICLYVINEVKSLRKDAYNIFHDNYAKCRYLELE